MGGMSDEVQRALDWYERLFEGKWEPEGYVGLAVDEAEDRARREKFAIRILHPDEQGAMTLELVPTRINLLVIDGRVHKAGVF